MSELSLVELHHNEVMTTSLTVAEGVNLPHASVIKLIRNYVEQLQSFGGVRFEIQPFATKGGIQHRELVWLNEQQATLLITLMRNSEIVVAFKVRLVRAFFDLRYRMREALMRQEMVRPVFPSEMRRRINRHANGLAQATFERYRREMIADIESGQHLGPVEEWLPREVKMLMSPAYSPNRQLTRSR